MADEITCTMVLTVDLQCPKCYKKISKVLAKFLQIRQQSYNVKENKVTITVVCCSPEMLRDKLCCKGGKTIKCIEIIKPPQKPKSPPEKPKPPEKPPPEKPKPPDKPPPPEQPKIPNPIKKPKNQDSQKSLAPQPVSVHISVPGYPPGGACYEGCGGGPCYQGYGRPIPCYDNYGYGPNRGGYRRCDYFSEENTSGCTIM